MVVGTQPLGFVRLPMTLKEKICRVSTSDVDSLVGEGVTGYTLV